MPQDPSTPGRPPNQRTLAAIVFTDVVSFSARMQDDELGTLKLLQHDFEEMRRICTAHEGSVLKTTGDGLLLTFTSAVQAVACALAMQRQFAAEAKSRGANPLQHRVGIHLGDILVHDQDVMGDGVNIASRLQAEAEPGGICISQTVYDVVKNKLQMDVVSLGARELKNIAQAMPVYQLLLEAQALDAKGRPRRSSGAPFRFTVSRRQLLYAGGAVVLVAGLIAWGVQRRRARTQDLADGAPVAVMPAVLSSASATPRPAAPPAPAPEEKPDLAADLETGLNKRREVMRELHTLYLDKYDFNGLVSALRDKAESPSAAPGLKQLLHGAEQLAALKEWLDLALRHYNRQHPLVVHELPGETPKEMNVYLAADGRVTFLPGGQPQSLDWPELKPAVVGAIIVSAQHDAKRVPHNVSQAALTFARFYSLPAMSEALARTGH